MFRGFIRKTPLLAIGICLVLLWELLRQAAKVPDYLLPSPLAVLEVLWADRSIIAEHVIVTIEQWAIGMTLSVVLGFLFALVLFSSPKISNVLRPLLIVVQSVPYLVFAPLLMIWLGLGMLPKILLVVLSCSFPIALTLEKGLSNARSEFALTVVITKLSPLTALKSVYLPSALGDFFTGLRIATTYAFVSCVLAELIGSEGGLGIYIIRAQSSYRMDKVLAATLFIVVFTYLTSAIVDVLKKKFIFWDSPKGIE